MLARSGHLDLSWAWHDALPPSADFRGGLPHLLAPELAAAVCRGSWPVQPTAEDETYTLAATLWRCATGRWPLNYQAAGIDPSRLSAAQLRSLIASRQIPLDETVVWPTLQDVLRPILAAPRDARPSAQDLLADLSRQRRWTHQA